jgi:hypothetical protein
MNRPTQIYLSPEQHDALAEAARRSGRSKAHVIRELIDVHLVADAPPPTDLTGLAGSVHLGRPTDVGRDTAQMLREAVADLRRQ